eukprot:CAMPEP_0204868732 /NCGR_PEP_ID=MMETSP1348-20121228/27721_1 /ASSEMBLY_ACC=CAM_ASM_000700 /TAXON_ID=215587 /ORGANISM="Aplanochytrium stocchinoi, Strain GSBS06" /LENGTH=283 /DNA_ID=CAMNT_0052021803 /DNA_START=183 /DNA_END=1035 /DNA_ORIENTATION=-
MAFDFPQVPQNYFSPARPEDFPKQGPHARFRSPSFYKLDYEDIRITTLDNHTLQAWLMKNSEREDTNSIPTLLFLHGNAGHIGLRTPFYERILKGVRCNILALEYRGYGNSSGTPSERGLIRDTHAALDYLHGRDDIGNIVLYGRSLGGAVAIATASIYRDDFEKFAGLIVENTFLSIEDVVHSHLEEIVPDRSYQRILKKVLQMVLRLRWKSKDRIHAIKKPVLFLSGRMDELIPPHHMDTLYSMSTSKNKYMKEFFYGDHNGTWCELGFCEALEEFLQDLY